jgi:hypothetical protein
MDYPSYPNEVIYNFLVDLKKRDINPIDRAKIIRKYCNDQNISIRKLSTELGISHSTLQDWVDYERIDKLQYTKLLDSGYSKKSIYKMLRDTRSDKKEFESITKIELNVILKDTDMRIKGHINNTIFDAVTIDLLKELRNTLNRIELHIERENKNKRS